jgi:histidinol-phosphate aminotransferase
VANKWIKSYIKALVPYSTARDEFTGVASVYLDANENPYQSSVNRYPDPHQRELKARIAELKGVDVEKIFVGNGSDEAIDLLVRVVDTGQGGITITSPTYGMYKVAAANNGVPVVDAPLKPDFSLDMAAIRNASEGGSRLLFLCSPNNPTGAQYTLDQIKGVLEAFEGIVVADEAYIDFAKAPSAITLLADYDRLVVLQTFSKAWGMAGIRLGMAFGAKVLIDSMNKLKLPYNVSELTQRYGLERLAEPSRMESEVREILSERARVAGELGRLKGVIEVFPSATNFLLVKVTEPRRAFEYLQAKGVIVRDRSKEKNCAGCLRITIGTPAENDTMLEGLREVL